MKKSVLLLFLGLFISGSTLCAKFDLGALNGIHMTDAEFEPSRPLSKTLYAIPQFGLFAKYSLNHNLSIQSSPSITSKKIVANQIINIELTSEFIEIPILLSYEFDFGLFRPYVFVGPNIGIIVNPKSTTYFNGKVEEDISEDVADIEYAIKGGLGLELEFETFSFFGQAYLNYGLNDLYTPPSGITFPEDVYLRTYGIQAGISFPLLK